MYVLLLLLLLLLEFVLEVAYILIYGNTACKYTPRKEWILEVLSHDKEKESRPLLRNENLLGGVISYHYRQN
jgi:hypothetical protein